jgi:GrpB-like predicted nucleotidyltransferase (UPF0157 family)
MTSQDPPAILKLIGYAQTIVDGSPESVLKFYGDHLPRLTEHVKHTGDLARYVAFQDQAEGDRRLHFLGIEVQEIADMPFGMIGWEFSQKELAVWNERQVTARRPIRWEWLSAAPGGGHPTGEFEVGGRKFWISANAYLDPQAPASDVDDVRLVDYDPTWPDQYAALRKLLVKMDPAAPLVTEHFGSTAVPGMTAKPVIDVLLEDAFFSHAKQWLVPLLNRPEWEYWWYAGHMVFIGRDGVGGPRKYHLHVAPRDHKVWRGIEFRDWLCAHPDDAARYAALKRDLAATHAKDRERYTLAKTEFVEEILAKVKS